MKLGSVGLGEAVEALCALLDKTSCYASAACIRRKSDTAEDLVHELELTLGDVARNVGRVRGFVATTEFNSTRAELIREADRLDRATAVIGWLRVAVHCLDAENIPVGERLVTLALERLKE